MKTRRIVILLAGLFVGTIAITATEPRSAPTKFASTGDSCGADVIAFDAK